MVATETALYHILKNERGFDIVDVAFHEESGAVLFLVISMRKAYPPEAWQVLKIADAYSVIMGKIIIAVDDDIDARDLDSVLWALCFRMQPHRDVLIVPGEEAALDPSAGPPGGEVPPGHVSPPTSAMLIDATRKWDYPPISLPARFRRKRSTAKWCASIKPSLSVS